MAVLTITETMLYCPKCQQTYEDGSQRFCSIEGERLVHASANKTAVDSNGAFVNVLTSNPNEETSLEEKTEVLKSAKRSSKIQTFPGFCPPSESKIFKSESDTAPALENVISNEKPAIRTVKPNEIAISQARLGDRKTNPTDERLALTRENPDVLLGETVKGRYLISEKLGQDENSIAFLAEDKIVAGRKVLVNVLMNEDADDDFENSIFAEERVSLAHINHPNIASVIDSGELLEGKPFIVTELVKGKSVKDVLIQKGQFDPKRAARIVRRVSYALSEAHESGILHRNLIPENIILTVGENGAEHVKLTNFGISKGELNKANIYYKSPEQIERKPATFTADNFSLAVIAYQMLTNRLPFKGSAKKELLKMHRGGLVLRPTDLRFDLTPEVDRVLEKALSFNPIERFTTARDFGDAFFSALEAGVSVPAKGELKKTSENFETKAGKENGKAGLKDLSVQSTAKNVSEVSSPEVVQKTTETDTKDEIKASHDLSWEKRSPEPPKVAGKAGNFLAFFGIAVLLAGLLGVWYYFINRSGESVQLPVENSISAERNAENALPNKKPIQNPSPNTLEIEVPPIPRSISQPPETIFFENNRQNLKGLLLRNFAGFSLYYPESWTRNETDNKFLDISKKSTNGLPVEQLLIGYYESRGTLQSDREILPVLVENSNRDLKKIIPNYQVLSEGETKINGGWKAYEVKFQGGGSTKKGEEKLILWGRRFWIPAARPGTSSGYLVTLLATSLSPDVTGVDDVGVKGDLAKILETFEPNQSF